MRRRQETDSRSTESSPFARPGLPEELEADNLFSEALQRPSHEWPAFLDEKCADRPRLRRMVEELLALATDRWDPLLDGARHHQQGWLQEAEGAFQTDLPGQRLGPYKLLHEIGRGGMGVVYLAERADGEFEQKVALKLVQLGASSGRLTRFRRERQILATLDDVRIARLLDGGVTVEGLPFLVMEYVDGQAIDKFCESRQLTIHRRLELFLETCRAVSAAHRQLVVHRDLKPSNILVNDQGAVKLLDFGIAKLLTTEGGPESSAEWTRAMTPSYASPEQFLGEPITVASDVYQLGLLLYRLLSGRMPYDVRTGGAVKAEKLICQIAPPKPSVALKELSRDDGTALSSGTFPIVDVDDLKAWERALRGDLDNIAGKALAKLPKDRYSSVDALIDDIERYLAGRPVAARQPTFGYVVGKFIGRHRWAVAAALGVITLVLSLILGYTWQLQEERDRAERARVVAEQAKDEAVKLSASLVDLFALADPERGADDPVDALDLLDRSIERVRSDLEQHPVSSSRLLYSIAEIYTKLDRQEEAASLLEEVLAIRRELLPGDHPEVAETANQLGMLFGYLKRFDEAEALLDEALKLREKAGDKELEALTLNNLGNLRWRQGQLREAELFHRRALELRENLPEPDPARVGDSLNNLGVLLNAQGRDKDAVPFSRRAVEMHEEAYGPRHAVSAVARNNLGIVMFGLGRWTEAEQNYRRAAAVWREAYGPTHTRTLRAEYNVASCFRWMGKQEEGLEGLRLLLAKQESLSPPAPGEVARTLNLMGSVLVDLERFTEAKPHLERAVALRVEHFGDEHPFVLISRYNLARLWRRSGDDRAGEELSRLLDLGRRVYGADSSYVASVSCELGILLAEEGDRDAARSLLETAVAIRRERKPPLHPLRAFAETALNQLSEPDDS